LRINSYGAPWWLCKYISQCRSQKHWIESHHGAPFAVNMYHYICPWVAEALEVNDEPNDKGWQLGSNRACRKTTKVNMACCMKRNLSEYFRIYKKFSEVVFEIVYNKLVFRAILDCTRRVSWDNLFCEHAIWLNIKLQRMFLCYMYTNNDFQCRLHEIESGILQFLSLLRQNCAL
jgi:hypothetical protein